MEKNIALTFFVAFSFLFFMMGMLWPGRRLPGLRVFLWLIGTLGTVSLVKIARYTGLVQPVPILQPGFSLLQWFALLAIALGFIVDLKGRDARGHSMSRFLRGSWPALHDYRLPLAVSAVFVLMSGMLGMLHLNGLPWGDITLLAMSLFALILGGLFYEERTNLAHLAAAQARPAGGAAETWLLLDGAGRILDLDDAGLAWIKQPRSRVVGESIYTLLPQTGKMLAYLESDERLDMDAESDFFGPLMPCRFSLYYPLRVQTIYEPRLLRVRSLPVPAFQRVAGEGTEESYAEMLRKMDLMQMALEASLHGVMLTDSAGNVVYRNQVLIQVLDLPDHALLAEDEDWKEMIARRMKDPERLLNFIDQIRNQAVGETLDIIERSDGRLLECRTRYQTLETTGTGYRLWDFLDCTEQQRRERELQHIGMHDTLTGIYNRAFFEIKLRQLRLMSLYPVCMFMVDVDGLKQVNDYQGHPAGDQVLRQAAYILRQACRTDDMVARLGGDEFGLLLIHADREVAEQVASRIQGLLNIYNIRNPETPVSISMGYAVATSTQEMETLFSRADETMYDTRRKHRSGQEFTM